MSVGATAGNITNVLGVAGSITTVLSLAALSLLIAYLLAGHWLRGKRAAAEQAIARSDDVALARLLGGTSVPLDSLSPEQKFSLATEDLRTRKHQRIMAYALLFFGFLALLGFALALALFSPDRSSGKGATPNAAAAPGGLDPIRALEVLRFVPPAGRAEACARLLSQADCTRAASMIADLAYQEPTAQQGQALGQALERGSVTPGQLRELAACGGSYDFRIEGGRLLCADGSPVPNIAEAGPGQALARPEAVVFHSTETSDVSLDALARLIAVGREGLTGPLSHILISRSGAVIQTAPLDRRAIHVGPSTPWRGLSIVNSNSIGVQMVHVLTGRDYSAAQIEAAKGVVRALVRAYGIRAVVGHSEVAAPPGRKADPGPLFPIEAMREVAAAAAR